MLAILRTAHPVEHHLTIAEGLTAQQIVAVLAHAEAMTGTVRAVRGRVPCCRRPTTTNMAPTGRDRGAGKGGDGQGPGRRLGRPAPGLPLSSPREALILASIVERETAKPEERPHIAAVYLNRLRLGMKLQADPTVVYLASNGAGVLDHPLTTSRTGAGRSVQYLPQRGFAPAPICSPGLDSLHAVLHPAASDDLYFVADGAGGHVFSRTFEAHAVAVARWRTLVPSAAHGGTD